MIKQTVLETKEKEPALQEAKTSSSKNNSINNDNTKTRVVKRKLLIIRINIINVQVCFWT